jgi:glycine betaine/proline transport system ATP-binding protein
MSLDDEILSVKNIYKVFGANPKLAMDMLGRGADKEEIFSRVDHGAAVQPID